MTKEEFNIEDLEFFLPDKFKGLTKEYIINCVFNENIQKNWNPRVGDVIVGPTGNVFVISGEHHLTDKLGGNLFFFGGSLCNRTGGHILDDTYCFTLNKDGKYYRYTSSGIEAREESGYSAFSHFRYVPYPHELQP